jgi:hypothetical protein
VRSEYSRPNEYLSFIASTHDYKYSRSDESLLQCPTLTIMTYMCIISCVQYIQYTTVYIVSTAIVALTVVVRVLVIHVIAGTVDIFLDSSSCLSSPPLCSRPYLSTQVAAAFIVVVWSQSFVVSCCYCGSSWVVMPVALDGRRSGRGRPSIVLLQFACSSGRRRCSAEQGWN